MAQLLVSSCGGEHGGLYSLDTETGELGRIFNSPIRGITPGPGGYYAVSHTGSVYVFEPATWQVEERARLPFNGCHDLRWDGEHFYLAVVYGNQVVRLDERFRVTDRIQIADDEDDVVHPNCLTWVDGRMVLSVFTLAPGRREDKRFSDAWRTHGKLLALDWRHKRFDVIHEPLSQPHSLVSRGGDLYCCESPKGWITRISLRDQATTRIVRLPGFVRGLAFCGPSAYVGISKHRGRHSLLGKMLNSLRLKCGIVELDAETWQRKRVFPIPGTDVYEIIRLDHAPLPPAPPAPPCLGANGGGNGGSLGRIETRPIPASRL